MGERNALVFNQAGAKAIPREELPDSFFDLTVEDAKVLLRDAKKNLDKLEESPLLTETQRQLDNDKKTLSQLHKYQRAIIRIQFPNQLVLQGLFGPLETVQTIKDFVKTYLENPEKEFTLCKYFFFFNTVVTTCDQKVTTETIINSIICNMAFILQESCGCLVF